MKKVITKIVFFIFFLNKSILNSQIPTELNHLSNIIAKRSASRAEIDLNYFDQNHISSVDLNKLFGNKNEALIIRSIWDINIPNQDTSELVSKKENFEKSELQLHLFKITGILSTVLFFLSFFIVSILVDVISGQNLSQFISRNVEVFFAISLLIGCFAFLWDGVLLGLDKSKEFSIITILSSILGGILCNALLTYSNTIEMLWVSLNFSLIIRCVLGFYFQRNS